MDKIALFGGTGYVGSRLREMLLESGYSVRMLVRKRDVADRLGAQAHIETVVGNIADATAVQETIRGSRAVMVVTGPRTQRRSDMLEVVQGTRNVLDAMQELGVARLIKLSGTSVRIAGEPFPLMRRFLDVALHLAMFYPTRSKYLEHKDIFASGLDWVVVRPPAIAPGKVRGTFCADASAWLGLKVARDDLCRFMIAQIDSDEWLHRCPTLGYRPSSDS